MSKKASRFSKSSGWTSREGGGAEKSETCRPARADVSAGSQHMADGGRTSNREAEKQRVLAAFRVWRKEHKDEFRARCPFCKQPVSVKKFERHVRRGH